MSLSISDWFNNSSNKPTKESDSPCESKKADCMQVLQDIHFILDGEATDEQQKHFEAHVEECMPCFERYNLDKTIKQVIQTRVSQKDIPFGLVDEIKFKINNLA